MHVQELTLEEQIGQLLICGVRKPGLHPDLEELVATHKIGGVILFQKNYTSYAEMVTVMNRLHSLNQNHKVPLWIGIDQEGGRCNRMPSEFLNLYSAAKLARTRDINLVKRAARITGKMLKETGIHINFAPILDIQRFPDNHAIGNRCYGTTPEEVITYAIPVIEELKKQGILAIAKHFPGHGLATENSHITLPTVIEPMSFIEQNDIAPFKTAIEHGVDGIMLAHLRVTALDTTYPASLSSQAIQHYLRTKLHYKGLVITDDFHMLPMRLGYGSVRAGKLAFLAGNDCILSHSSKTSIVKTISAIQKLVTHSLDLQESLSLRVARILELKHTYAVSDAPVTGANIEEINHEIYEINKIVETSLHLPVLRT